MGTDSLFKDCYVTVVHGNSNSDYYGRMVNCYPTEEEARNHIKYQKEVMGSTGYWNILHIKDMEWISFNKK